MPNTRRRLVKMEDSVHGQIFSAPEVNQAGGSAEEAYLALRQNIVRRYFPQATGVDDFMARVEMQLCDYGFTPENSIAVLNLCRDEICNSLKHKVEPIFGQPFNVHGLGGVLTCGVTGMGAGLSHAPQSPGQREKYIFFSFPHIAVNAAGELGEISRASRHHSHACGAMLKVLGELKSEEHSCSSHKVGQKEVHSVMDPEYSILKHRMEQHIGACGIPHNKLRLDTLTLLAEEAITQDLETLIAKAVDTSKADYAVVTGVQIHNWSMSFDDEEPNLEFIQPRSVYVVNNGVKTELDLNNVSALTPRMFQLLSAPAPAAAAPAACTHASKGSLKMGTVDHDPKSKSNVIAASKVEKKYRKYIRPAHGSAEESYLALRQNILSRYFPDAVGSDDFVARIEMELCKYGFTSENSIAVLNLCRDEICNSLKHKIQPVFGAPFNVHGLGAVLTCGVTGMGAGLSHAPQVRPGAREKYIFFSFPHVAVNAAGELGEVGRASRSHSHACGALLKVLGELKKEGNADSGHKVGQKEVHNVMDPEYSILKHRLEQHIGACGIPHDKLRLDTLTLLAEEAITQDLESLIQQSVDTSKADYAVVTGVQIHNWAVDFEDDEPNLEFVLPRSVYVVNNGVKTNIDVKGISSLTPRMFEALITGGKAKTAAAEGAIHSSLRALKMGAADDSDARDKPTLIAQRETEKKYKKYIRALNLASFNVLEELSAEAAAAAAAPAPAPKVEETPAPEAEAPAPEAEAPAPEAETPPPAAIKEGAEDPEPESELSVATPPQAAPKPGTALQMKWAAFSGLEL